MTEDELESKYPGIKCAYDFVFPSYQWMLARLEGADSRIQTLQTLAIRLMLTPIGKLEYILIDR
jgi:hypothetical protein